MENKTIYTIIFIILFATLANAQSTINMAYTRSFVSTGDYFENGITLEYYRQLNENYFIGLGNTWLVGYTDPLGLSSPLDSENEPWLVDKNTDNRPFPLEGLIGEDFKDQKGKLLSTKLDQDLNILFPLWFGRKFNLKKHGEIKLLAGANIHYSDQRYIVLINYEAIVQELWATGKHEVLLPTWYFKRLLTIGFNLQLEYNYRFTEQFSLGLKGSYFRNINSDQIFSSSLGVGFNF